VRRATSVFLSLLFLVLATLPALAQRRDQFYNGVATVAVAATTTTREIVTGTAGIGVTRVVSVRELAR